MINIRPNLTPCGLYQAKPSDLSYETSPFGELALLEEVDRLERRVTGLLVKLGLLGGLGFL